MKKNVILACATLVVAGLVGQNASAAGYGMAGCGLGSMVIDRNEMLPQIGSAILNSIYGNQTFAITSGTSGCDEDAGKTAQMFISINRVALQKDISRGNGETLANYSSLIGCKDAGQLGGVLQKNYEGIFTSEELSSSEISAKIQGTIKSDAKLASSCELS